MTLALRENSLRVTRVGHTVENSSRIGGRVLVRFLYIFFSIPCTSSILFSEPCEVNPWARMKWMCMMVLEYVFILWVVI